MLVRLAAEQEGFLRGLPLCDVLVDARGAEGRSIGSAVVDSAMGKNPDPAAVAMPQAKFRLVEGSIAAKVDVYSLADFWVIVGVNPLSPRVDSPVNFVKLISNELSPTGIIGALTS